MIITEEKRTQIISYIVHAGEILQKDNHFPEYKYKYIYLPKGPELYTGVLKAAGYLFLDSDLNTIVFIVEQKDSLNQIITYINEENMLIGGRNIKNKGKDISNNNKSIPFELFEQLLYIRLLTKVNSIIMLGIGSEISRKQVIDKLNEIKDKNLGVVFLGGASEKNKAELSKREDKKMIEHMITKKLYNTDKHRLGNIYTNIVKNNKGKPELVAYVHSSDLGIKSIQQVGYICMVA